MASFDGRFHAKNLMQNAKVNYLNIILSRSINRLRLLNGIFVEKLIVTHCITNSLLL